MKRYKVINKTRFYMFVIVVVYISFSAFTFFKSFSNAEKISSLQFEEVCVKEGDTIWDIALEYKAGKNDIRDTVAEIRTFNEIDDLIIKPGDLIKIPLRKK